LTKARERGTKEDVFSFDQLAFADLSPAYFIILLMFGAVAYVAGALLVRVPVLRWFALIYVLYMGSLEPRNLTAYYVPAFYCFWSFIGAYVRRYVATRPSHSTALSFPSFSLSLPSLHLGGFTRFITSPFRITWRLLKLLYDTCKRIVGWSAYVLFITLPVRIIRLSFWLYKIFPHLKTRQGIIILLKELLAWTGSLLWAILPFAWKAEINRLKHGKSVKESFSDGLKEEYRKAQEKKKRQEEEELRRIWRKAKKFVWDEAKDGRDPFHQQSEPNCSSQQRSQAQGRSSHSSAHQSKSQNHQSQRRSSDPQKSNAQDGFWDAHENKASQDRQQRKQAQQQRTQSSQSQSQSHSSTQSQRQERKKPDPTQKKQADGFWDNTQKQTKKADPEPDSRSKAFYDKHKADFEDAGWIYDPMEERFTGGKSPYEVLGVSTQSDLQERKKAYKALSKKYLNYTAPRYATTVQNRANEIMKEINGAKERLIKKN